MSGRGISSLDWTQLQFYTSYGNDDLNDGKAGVPATAPGYVNQSFRIRDKGWLGMYVPYLSCRNVNNGGLARVDLEILKETDRATPSTFGRATIATAGNGTQESIGQDIEDSFAIQLPTGPSFTLQGTQGTPNVLVQPLYIPADWLLRARIPVNANGTIHFIIMGVIPVTDPNQEINLG